MTAIGAESRADHGHCCCDNCRAGQCGDACTCAESCTCSTCECNRDVRP